MQGHITLSLLSSGGKKSKVVVQVIHHFGANWSRVQLATILAQESFLTLLCIEVILIHHEIIIIHENFGLHFLPRQAANSVKELPRRDFGLVDLSRYLFPYCSARIKLRRRRLAIIRGSRREVVEEAWVVIVMMVFDARFRPHGAYNAQMHVFTRQ